MLWQRDAAAPGAIVAEQQRRKCPNADTKRAHDCYEHEASSSGLLIGMQSRMQVFNKQHEEAVPGRTVMRRVGQIGAVVLALVLGAAPASARFGGGGGGHGGGGF